MQMLPAAISADVVLALLATTSIAGAGFTIGQAIVRRMLGIKN